MRTSRNSRSALTAARKAIANAAVATSLRDDEISEIFADSVGSTLEASVVRVSRDESMLLVDFPALQGIDPKLSSCAWVRRFTNQPLPDADSVVTVKVGQFRGRPSLSLADDPSSQGTTPSAKETRARRRR